MLLIRSVEKDSEIMLPKLKLTSSYNNPIIIETVIKLARQIATFTAYSHNAFNSKLSLNTKIGHRDQEARKINSIHIK